MPAGYHHIGTSHLTAKSTLPSQNSLQNLTVKKILCPIVIQLSNTLSTAIQQNKTFPRSIYQFLNISLFVCFYLGFLSLRFTIYRTAGEGGGYFITPFFHFHPLHGHLDIRWTITSESSPLHISSSRS